MIFRFLVPPFFRHRIRLGQRKISDWRKGYVTRFARASAVAPDFPYAIRLEQEIKKSHLFENKVANIRRASGQISQVVVQPGDIFSFWAVIGPPTARNGYLKGRNIIAGKLSEAYGGGLCQVSSILYHLSLMAGLTIIERHNHSVDIYTPETRFTPLGSDATVAYGYKDLRVLNPYPFPLRFELEVGEGKLKARLWSGDEILERRVEFIVEPRENLFQVRAIDGEGKVVGLSDYRTV